MFRFAIIVAVMALQWGSVRPEFYCPSPNGFFPDPVQCDKYYACRGDEPQEKMCKDGLVFNPGNPLYERCDYPFVAKCGSRTQLQPADESTNCPRRNGLFSNPQSKNCRGFWQCKDGLASKMTCQSGLAFNPSAGTCQWNYLVPNCEDKKPDSAT